MALPAAPANCAVKRGMNPGHVIVTLAAVTAAPAVTSYTCYVSDDSGVSNNHYDKKKTSTSNIFHFDDLNSSKIYAIGKATNATGDSPLSPSGNGHTQQ